MIYMQNKNIKYKFLIRSKIHVCYLRGLMK